MSSSSTNSTRRKRLARAWAAQANLTYQQALDDVRRLSEAGGLPARLDNQQDAALAALEAARTPASPSGPAGSVEVRQGRSRNEVSPAAAPVDRDKEFVQQRFRPNRLVETPDGTLVKISNFYDTRVTATVEIPNPGRTTVRWFTYAEASFWEAPSRRLLRAYDEKYGWADRA